jgi:hypothetical protein
LTFQERTFIVASSYSDYSFSANTASKAQEAKDKN